MLYLWFKLLHIFFVISWFAGLFYLPRIFVNLSMVTPAGAEYERLLMMADKLARFMTPLGVLAIGFAIGTVFLGGLGHAHWVHGKAFWAIFLLGYNIYCIRLLRCFEQYTNRHSHRWYRIFNELPVIAMLAALFLVIFKPMS